jgi:hypothetical protein
MSRAVVPGPRGIGFGAFGQRASLCQRARGMACWMAARAWLDWSLCRAMVSRNRRFGLVLRIGQIRFPCHKNGRHNNSFERTALSGRRSTQTLAAMSKFASAKISKEHRCYREIEQLLLEQRYGFVT